MSGFLLHKGVRLLGKSDLVFSLNCCWAYCSYSHNSYSDSSDSSRIVSSDRLDSVSHGQDQVRQDPQVSGYSRTVLTVVTVMVVTVKVLSLVIIVTLCLREPDN